MNLSESIGGLSAVQILILIALIGVAPSLLIMTTSFARIIIALHFLRSALGTQQAPPNQILVGLALFLSLFVMAPAFDEIYEKSITPYAAGQISEREAIERGAAPLREFMLKEAEEKDVALFLDLAGLSKTNKDDIPTRVLIPAFIIGEITKGFKFGILVYIPFIVIDMVVASVLMAMGMMMLPPAMISLPFKLMIFILAGGWDLIIENLIRTFR
jgi:flagellar biosynthetic protein FliP